jgi:hypothetical protein
MLYAVCYCCYMLHMLPMLPMLLCSCCVYSTYLVCYVLEELERVSPYVTDKVRTVPSHCPMPTASYASRLSCTSYSLKSYMLYAVCCCCYCCYMLHMLPMLLLCSCCDGTVLSPSRRITDNVRTVPSAILTYADCMIVYGIWHMPCMLTS